MVTGLVFGTYDINLLMMVMRLSYQKISLKSFYFLKQKHMDKIIKLIRYVGVSGETFEGIMEFLSDFGWLNEEGKEHWNLCWNMFVRDATEEDDVYRLRSKVEDIRGSC